MKKKSEELKKIQKVQLEELKEKLGYRKDFDLLNRFDLKTKVGDYEVSTVDLGINHQFVDGLPPLYYETMIFYEPKNKNKNKTKKPKGNIFEYYQERYSTEEEARKGHKLAVNLVKEVLNKSFKKNDKKKF